MTFIRAANKNSCFGIGWITRKFSCRLGRQWDLRRRFSNCIVNFNFHPQHLIVWGNGPSRHSSYLDLEFDSSGIVIVSHRKHNLGQKEVDLRNPKSTMTLVQTASKFPYKVLATKICECNLKRKRSSKIDKTIKLQLTTVLYAEDCESPPQLLPQYLQPCD